MTSPPGPLAVIEAVTLAAVASDLHRRLRTDFGRDVRPASGDEEGCASWLRAVPFGGARPARRVRSLAANPFGCKHDSESGRLDSASETAAMPLKEPRRFRPELAAQRLASKHPPRSVAAEGGLALCHDRNSGLVLAAGACRRRLASGRQSSVAAA
jgi:hypothetical protein